MSSRWYLLLGIISGVIIATILISLVILDVDDTIAPRTQKTNVSDRADEMVARAEEGDLQDAVWKDIEDNAWQGHVPSMRMLGKAIFFGRTNYNWWNRYHSPSWQSGVMWLQRAAKHGDAESLQILQYTEEVRCTCQ